MELRIRQQKLVQHQNGLRLLLRPKVRYFLILERAFGKSYFDREAVLETIKPMGKQ